MWKEAIQSSQFKYTLLFALLALAAIHVGKRHWQEGRLHVLHHIREAFDSDNSIKNTLETYERRINVLERTLSDLSKKIDVLDTERPRIDQLKRGFAVLTARLSETNAIMERFWMLNPPKEEDKTATKPTERTDAASQELLSQLQTGFSTLTTSSREMAKTTRILQDRVEALFTPSPSSTKKKRTPEQENIAIQYS